MPATANKDHMRVIFRNAGAKKKFSIIRRLVDVGINILNKSRITKAKLSHRTSFIDTDTNKGILQIGK